MITIRQPIIQGIQQGVRQEVTRDFLFGGAFGSGSSGSVTPSFQGFGAIVGGSNGLGMTDYNATQADLGYGFQVPFTASLFNQTWAVSPTDPMTFLSTGSAPLAAYAAAGQNNMGSEQALGRWMVNYGLASNPFIVKWDVGALSLRRHFIAAYPTTGSTNYQSCVGYLNARQTEAGRKLEFLVWNQGEVDANDATDAPAYASNLATAMANLRADLGNPGLFIVIVGLNSSVTMSLKATVRSAQSGYVAVDSNSVLISTDDLPVPLNAIYPMGPLTSIGNRIGVALRNRFAPGQSTSLSQGSGFPSYQQTDPGSTAVSGALSIPRTGEDPSSVVREYLVAASYPSTGTLIVLSGSGAGFTQIDGQINSTFSTTIRRSMAVFERIIAPGVTPTGSVPGRWDSPTVQYLNSTQNLNVARIFGVSGSVTGSTINFVTASNNANGTTLVFPAVTSSVANSTAFMFFASAGTGQSVASVANPSMSNLSLKWASNYNPGAGVVDLCHATAQLPTAGAYGQTTVTFTGTGATLGFMSVLAPASVQFQGFVVVPGAPSTLHTLGVSTVQLSASGLVGGVLTDLTNTTLWTSANPLVAAVLPGGLVTGLVPGTTTITATAFDGTQSQVTVTVAL